MAASDPSSSGHSFDIACFDHLNYRSRYPDLAQLSDQELEAHWLEFGKSEGRTFESIPLDFSHSRYRSIYSDLATFTDTELEEHWLQYGRKEGRRYDLLTREEILLKHVSKEKKGLEIAPWFRPLAPKKHGYNCMVLDVFNKQRLIDNASADPEIPDDFIPNIEDVDFVGSASDLANLLCGRIDIHSLDYIISSHNFEHIPNPIAFLQNCAQYLRSTGLLIMAIPDLRCCFDYFRWPTTLVEWLNAYYANKVKPDSFDVFRDNFCRANNFGRIDYPRSEIVVETNLKNAFEQLNESLLGHDSNYIDAHCSVFTPSSFQLLIAELNYLGLISLQVVDVSMTHGNEFFVHLAPAKEMDKWSDADFCNIRRRLLSAAIDDIKMKS